MLIHDKVCIKALFFFCVTLQACFVVVPFVSSSLKLKGIIHMKQDNPARTLSWGCLLSGFLVMLHSRKFVKKGEILVHPDTRFTGLPNDISFTF